MFCLTERMPCTFFGGFRVVGTVCLVCPSSLLVLSVCLTGRLKVSETARGWAMNAKQSTDKVKHEKTCKLTIPFLPKISIRCECRPVACELGDTALPSLETWHCAYSCAGYYYVRVVELSPQALESNPRVAAGVHQAGDAFGSLVRNVSGLAQQAVRGWFQESW